MRMIVMFEGRTLADVLKAIDPVQPLLVVEDPGFLAAELSPEKIEELRAANYNIRPDTQFGID